MIDVSSSTSFPTLTTPRLTLRRLKPGDAFGLFRFRSDPEVQRYNGGVLTAHSQAEKLIEDLELGFVHRSMIHWALSLVPDGEIIGLFGFANWSWTHRRAEIGYCLDKEHWGQGFGREALEAMLAYGFASMDLHRVHACTWVENIGSVRLLESCGFVREGVMRGEYYLEGSYHDEAHYGLLRGEYEARRAH